jgi:hypothetical protein
MSRKRPRNQPVGTRPPRAQEATPELPDDADSGHEHMLPPDLHENELEERSALMRRDAFIVAIAGLSLVNGTHFSPLFDPAFLLFRNFAPAFFISSQVLIFYFTSLFLATFTLVLAGVPAALFERFTGRRQSDMASLALWFACLVPLSLPALMALVNR